MNRPIGLDLSKTELLYSSVLSENAKLSLLSFDQETFFKLLKGLKVGDVTVFLERPPKSARMPVICEDEAGKTYYAGSFRGVWGTVVNLSAHLLVPEMDLLDPKNAKESTEGMKRLSLTCIVDEYVWVERIERVEGVEGVERVKKVKKESHKLFKLLSFGDRVSLVVKESEAM